MLTKDEIEGFLIRLAAEEGASYQEANEGLWIIKPGGELDFDVVCHYTTPVVLFRVKVMDIPSDDGRCATLNKRLLELNANDLVHGSYGISDNAIVLTEALELSSLDYDEFLSTYESMTLALAAHLRELSTFREAR